MTPNTDLPPLPSAEAEQGASAGCAPTAGSRSSDTPESDELAAMLIHPDSLMSFRKYIKRSLKLCRKLERQRDEARDIARNADLRVTRAKRERDGAWAARERLANAITNAAGVLSSENSELSGR